ncbi:MAG: chromosome partitioning protein ParA, partial [Alphaproteobacteria bacterium]|nr:chromosome partitioning protein ParA [Alphaproteobacteria bacterium]
MLDFTKLQLHGFKSFVEPTTLLIEPGLTGIVGPNGCGKSNLIEALRCVMGENSARRMRAPDMDNVIFSGTATRPSRNLAEISLWLDNSGRTAPAEFNDQHELQVTRVIERGEGSLYHINGRPVRQRDVQMVFADQATGAQANNIVGQGQIDALIRAKPQDRRKILEEAAGITGLEARRHEAELKLKAAEQNLQRAEDVLKTYESQQRSLKSQLRAAQRYRELNDGIQAHDMLLLHVRQQLVTQQIAETNQQMAILEHEIESLTQQITLTETARIEKTNELPPMRQAEAAAAALLQRLTLELEKIQAEQARVTKEQLNLQQQMAAAHNDHTHADHQLDDALATLQKLYTEQSQRQQQLEALRSLLPARAHDHHLVAEQVHAAEQNLHTLLATIAETESQRTSYQNQLQRAQAQVHTMQQRQADLESTRAHWEQQKRELPDLTLAKSMVDACEADVQKKQEQLQAAEQAEHDADATAKEAQQKVDAAQHELTKLRAEETALRDLLESQRGLEQRVLDLLEGTGGFETALAVAFGEALTAALNDEAPSYWQQRTLAAPLPPLPVGAEPLSQLVQAPAELQSLLSMTGLVNSDDEGRALAAQLLPGQILVTRDGWAWRWDGYTITPKATTTYATQLRQRARLQELAQLTKQSAQLLQNLQTHETMAREKFLLTRQAATDM